MWAGLQGWLWGEKGRGKLGRVGWRVGRRKEEEKVIRTRWSAGEAEDPGSVGVGWAVRCPTGRETQIPSPG